ncbi:MAG: hypothetical protein SGBAC_012386 [Bacillariaceae sp.]
MTTNTESATSKLIGKAIDVIMAEFDFEFDQTPLDISESVEPETEDSKEVEEILQIARERRIRKQGNRDDVDSDINDSLRTTRSCMRTSFCSVASFTTMGEDDAEYELPLNDSAEEKRSNTSTMRRASLTSLLQAF